MSVRAIAIVLPAQPETDFTFRFPLVIFAPGDEEQHYAEVHNDTYFGPNDSEIVVKVELYRFIKDYILTNWNIALGSEDTIRIINSFIEIDPVVALSHKFVSFWAMSEDTAVPRMDSILVNAPALIEVGTVTREATPDGSWAARFDGGANYLNRANAGETYELHAKDFLILDWSKYNAAGIDVPLFSWWNTDGLLITFALWRRHDTGMLELRSWNGVSFDTYATTLHIDDSDTIWNCIVLWHEAATDTVTIKVNAMPQQTIVLTTPIPDETIQIVFGSTGFGGVHFKGSKRRFGFGNFLPTAAELAIMFNSGQGQDWPFEGVSIPPVPSGSGYVRVTNGVVGLTAGQIAGSDLVDASVDILTKTTGFPGGSTTFLRADGSFATPPGGGGSHALDHQSGGSDEVDVTGLIGLLADPQTPVAHGSSHQSGWGDDFSVAGLVGLLADPQLPLVTGATVGDIMYYNGSAWVRLPAGTAGQVLTMDSGGNLPEWQ